MCGSGSSRFDAGRYFDAGFGEGVGEVIARFEVGDGLVGSREQAAFSFEGDLLWAGMGGEFGFEIA